MGGGDVGARARAVTVRGLSRYVNVGHRAAHVFGPRTPYLS
jgi:hypothetical protein